MNACNKNFSLKWFILQSEIVNRILEAIYSSKQ